MPEEYASQRQPQRDGRLDEILSAKFEKFSADKAGIVGPCGQTDYQHYVEQAPRKKRDDCYDEEKDGDSHHNLNEPHTDKVGFAARIAEYRPDYDSNDARYSDGDEANGQRDSAAVYKPTENIGANIVGAEPVLQIRRLLADLQIGPAKAIRHRRKDRTRRLARSNHRFVIGGVEPTRYENKQEYNSSEHYKNAYGNLPPQNPCAD